MQNNQEIQSSFGETLLVSPVKRKKKVPISKVVINITLVVLSIILLIPAFSLISTALKDDMTIIRHPEQIIPNPVRFDNFIRVFGDPDFLFFTYLGNSVFITLITMVGVVMSSALVAYGFTRFDVRHKSLIFGMMLAAMMIPGQVLQIPTYELFQSFGWINTFFPFIIPPFLGGGIVNVFLLRQFFNTLPKALYEAAEIDGASELRIFFQLVLPLSKAILFTIGVFTFTASWNDFFGPLIYLNEESMYTLAYGVYVYFSQKTINTQTAWNLISAANIVTIIPVVVLYAFAQKYFVQGIVLGGVKG